MIDLKNIQMYRENNRIEAKLSLGGLPKSLWETYSAFANTMGGILLLGVEEYKDKSLHIVNLPEPEKLVEEFFEIINNPCRVSANILSEQDVSIEEIDGKRIIVIHVPRARRYERPVYIDNDLYHGTYRRNGEGDYHCTREEILDMLYDCEAYIRDIAPKTLILEYLTDHITGTNKDFQRITGLSAVRILVILKDLLRDDLIVIEGTRGNRVYRLKA